MSRVNHMFRMKAHEKQVLFSLGRDVDETFCLRVPIVRTDGKDWHPLWITDYYLEPPMENKPTLNNPLDHPDTAVSQQL